MNNLQLTGPGPAMPFGLPLAPLIQHLVGNAYTPSSAPHIPPPGQHPSQTQSLAPSWASQPGQLLSGPTITIPVLLQQAILNHMMSLSPDNTYSGQLSLLVTLVVQQQQNVSTSTPAGPSQSNTQSMVSTPSVSSAPSSRRNPSPNTANPERKSKTPSISQQRDRARPFSTTRPQAKSQLPSASSSATLKSWCLT